MTVSVIRIIYRSIFRETSIGLTGIIGQCIREDVPENELRLLNNEHLNNEHLNNEHLNNEHLNKGNI